MKRQTNSFLDADSLEVMTGEVEELENDELSMEEAGFLQGYEDDVYDDIDIFDE